MKQCPACKTAYTDDSLSYCLSDGTALNVIPDEEPTVARDRAKEPLLRVGVPAPDATVVIKPNEEVRPKPNSMKWIAVAAIGLLLGVAALAALGLAGAAFYYGSAGDSPAPPKRTPTPRPTSTPDSEKERLREELANAQRRLDEQKRSSNTPNPPPANDDDHDGMAATGTVDSPGDGFLALRDYPDAERGNRLAKIPHGAVVEILNCEKKAVTVGGRSGRWCQVEYNGQNGWVFDAWLDY